MPLIVIYNPVCGDRTAKAFVDEHVLPTLATQGHTPSSVVPTEHVNHAGEIVLEHLKARAEDNGPLTVVLASGDGTLHEIANVLSEKAAAASESASPWDVSFVLVPAGTANALYASIFSPSAGEDTTAPAYKLQSLRAFLAAPSQTPGPLTIALTALSAAHTAGTPRITVRSAVVTSTALHASILHDSEQLRATIPGIGRFKVAAEANITRWYAASARLLPAPAHAVQIYNRTTRAFEDVGGSGSKGEVDLAGPFAYFLSTVNVDRLEPAFRIAPLAVDAPPGTMDVVIVRPKRDVSLADDGPEARAAFAAKHAAVLGGAYANGSHVDMVYGADGHATTDGTGAAVVEYFRVGGWEWTPDTADDAAHIVCADGTIFHLEKGETARSTVETLTKSAPTFRVFGR